MKKIGIVTSEQYKTFQIQVIRGIRGVIDNDYEIVIDSLGETPATRKDFSLDLASLSGLIVVANVLSDQQILDIHAQGIPITLVSHFIADTPIPTVIQNNVDGMTRLVDYMIDTCGRKNLVFIQGDMLQHDGIRRHQLFQEGMMKHDLSPYDAIYLKGNFDPIIAANEMLQLLEDDFVFDGVVAADYLMGCAALDILRFYEIDVPQAVSVGAFGDGSEALDMGLTVVGVNVIDLGRRAARQLLGQINGLRFSGVTWLNTELIVRDSS